MGPGQTEAQTPRELETDRASAVMASMRDGLLVIDPNRRVVHVNRRFCEMVGIHRERAIGAVPPYPWWPPDAHAGFYAGLDRIAAGEEIDFEGEILGPDGLPFAVEGRTSHLVAADGSIREHIVSIRDVSARRTTERALHESEQRLRTVFGAMNDGVVVLAADGVVVMVNDAACRILGLSRDEFLGRTPQDPRWGAVHPDGSPFPGESHPVAITLRTGVPQRGVVMGVDSPRHQERRWIRINSDAFGLAEGDTGPAVVATFSDITDEHRREAEVRRQRDFTEIVLRSMGETLLILAPDRSVLMVNDRFCRLVGLPRDALIGMRPPFPWWPPDQAPALGTLMETFGQGDTGTAEMDVVDALGNVIPVEVSRMLTTEADGARDLLLLTGRDISARKVREDALRSSEERFRAAFTATRDGMIIVGPDARVRACNPSACALLGRSSTALLGAEMGGLGIRVVDAAGEEIPHAHRPLLTTLVTGRAQRSVTVGVTRPDGSRVWVIESCEPLGPLDADGRAAGALITLTDITELMSVQAALQASEQRYRALYGYHADAVIRLGVDRRIVAASPSTWRVLRFDPDELPADLEALLPSDEGSDLAEAIGRMTEGEVGLVARTRMIRGDGRWIWAEVTGGPVYDADGVLVEVQLNVRDITDRVQREREVAALQRISTTIARGTDAAEVFSLIARELADITSADHVTVVKFDGRDGIVESSSGRSDRDAAAQVDTPIDLDAEETAICSVWKTGEACEVRVPGPDRRPDDVDRVLPEGGVDIAVPVRGLGDVLWGALRAGSGAALPVGTLDRMVRFADLASIAIASVSERSQLRVEAQTDPLTFLGNRRAFDRRLEFELRAQDGRPTCLIFFDIDDFKRVNDTHGHATGDHALKSVAARLRGIARTGDLVARLGGDEFAWILPDTDLDCARQRAEELLRTVGGTADPVIGPISLSIGLVEAIPGEPTAELIDRADALLYRAKRLGGARVCDSADVMDR